MSTTEIEPEGESDIFGVPTAIGLWELSEERQTRIVWQRQTDKTDTDTRDGQEKTVWEWVIIKKADVGGAWRSILKSGFVDTTMADTPQVTMIEQAPETNEGRQQVIDAAVEFMIERITDNIDEVVGGLTDDEERLIEEIVGEENADEIGGWHRVDPEEGRAGSTYTNVIQWANEAENIFVGFGYWERETDEGERDISFQSRLSSADSIHGVSTQSLGTVEKGLEDTLDRTINWMRSHNPNAARAAFTATIEGGIIIPIVDILRRFGGKTVIEAQGDALSIRSTRFNGEVDLRIGQGSMQSYDVQRQGEIVVDTDGWWDTIDQHLYGDDITIEAGETDDGRPFLRTQGHRQLQSDPVMATRAAFPGFEADRAFFRTAGLDFKDVLLAAREAPDGDAAFGVMDGVPILVVEGSPVQPSEGGARIHDEDVTEAFRARFPAKEVQGEEVVGISLEQLQDLRKAMPRPKNTDVSFTISDEVPLLSEFSIDGVDVDLRIALLDPEKIEDYTLSVPVAEIEVPEGETGEGDVSEADEEAMEAALEAAVEETTVDEEDDDEAVTVEVRIGTSRGSFSRGEAKILFDPSDIPDEGKQTIRGAIRNHYTETQLDEVKEQGGGRVIARATVGPDGQVMNVEYEEIDVELTASIAGAFPDLPLSKAELIAEEFGSLEAVQQATAEELLEVKGVGERTVEKMGVGDGDGDDELRTGVVFVSKTPNRAKYTIQQTTLPPSETEKALRELIGQIGGPSQFDDGTAVADVYITNEDELEAREFVSLEVREGVEVDSSDWAEAIRYLREYYGDDFQSRTELGSDLSSFAHDNDLPTSQSLGDEGVLQPIIRYQNVSPDDVWNQIQSRAGDDAEDVRDVIIAFAEAEAARDDDGEAETEDVQPPPEDEPEPEETSSILVSLMGGTKNYNVPGRLPGAIEDEGIGAARDTLGPPGQFNVNDVVGQITFRGADVISIDLSAGEKKLTRSEEWETAGELIVGELRLDVPEPPDGWESIHFINRNQANETGEGDRVVYVSPDRTLTLRIDGTRVSNKWSMRVLKHVEPLPADPSDATLLFGPGEEDSESDFVRLTHGNTVDASADNILRKNFPTVEEAEELFDGTDAVEAAIEKSAPGTDAEVIHEGDEWIVELTPTPNGVRFADDQPIVRSADELEFAVRGVLNTWEVHVDQSSIPFDEIEGRRREARQTVDITIPRFPMEEPDNDYFVTVEAPLEEYGDKYISIAPDTIVPEDEQEKVVDALRDEIGEEGIDVLFAATPRGSGNIIGEAFFERDALQGVEWDDERIEELLAEGQGEAEEVEEAEGEAEEPPEEPPEDFGRTVEGTFEEEAIEEGDLEEEVEAVDGEDLLELPIRVEDNFHNGNLYAPPSNTVRLAVSQQIDHAMTEELGPAEDFDIGSEVGSAFVTDESDPMDRNFVRVEGAAEEEPDETRGIPEPDAEAFAEPDELSQAEVETIVEQATIGIALELPREDYQEMREWSLDTVRGEGIRFRQDPEQITVRVGENVEEAIEKVLGRWAEFAVIDELGPQDIASINQRREALSETFGIDLPLLDQPTPVGLDDADIERVVEEATEALDAEVTVNPEADSLRIRLESVPDDTVGYSGSVDEVQGQATNPGGAIREALAVWENAIDRATVDIDALNRRRGRLSREFDMTLPEVERPVTQETVPGGRSELLDEYTAIMEDLETVEIQEERLAGVEEGAVPVEIDQEFSQFADDEGKTQIEQGLEVHHTEEIHDDVHAFIAQLLGSEPENFYDGSRPSELSGYDRFYRFTLTRSDAPGEWTNPRFAPSTLLELLAPLDGDRILVTSRGAPLA